MTLSQTYNIDEKDILIDDYKYSRVISYILDKHNWEKITDNATYSAKNKYSLIKTYLDGTENIFVKHKLAKNFKKYFFIPKSYSIENSEDINDVPETAVCNSIWFLKPSSMLIGGSQGIHILKINKGDKFRDVVRQHLKKNTSFVLQKNISNPMLLDDVKFDLRIFGVIVYTKTEFASYILNKGNVRYAVKKYKCDSINKKRLITNVSVHKSFTETELSKINHRLTDIYDSNHIMFTYFPVIKAIFKKIIKCSFKKFDNTEQNYGFIFIGLDVLIDSQGNVHIIEINQHPTLYDDSSTLKSAMNYKYHYGANHHIFKYFYDVIFNPIITNKLLNKDLGCFKITNYYTFMDNEFCEKKIICSDKTISLYKFTSQKKDVRRLHHLLNKQPDDYVDVWGKKYTLKQCRERIILSESDDILLCGIIQQNDADDKHKLVGIIGINFNKTFSIPTFNNKYFSHVIVDFNNQGRGLATTAMHLLLSYIKNNKIFNTDKIYASIYIDNEKSILFHKKINFVEELRNDIIVVMSYKI